MDEDRAALVVMDALRHAMAGLAEQAMRAEAWIEAAGPRARASLRAALRDHRAVVKQLERLRELVKPSEKGD